MAGIEYGKFILFNIIGAAIWISTMLFAGYGLGNLFPNLSEHLELIVAGMIILMFFNKENKTLIRVWANLVLFVGFIISLPLWFWFDRGTRVIEGKRSSLIIDPPDGRIPALTPEAQKREDDRNKELNREPVTDLEQFKKAYQEFRKAKPREAVVMVVQREGNTKVIRIEPPQ